MRAIISALILSFSASLSAEVVDTRSDAYQSGTFHLAQAQQALLRAISELKRAEVEYEFPGLNLTHMIGQIQQVEQTTTLILSPERKRLEAKTLVPNGTFFKPVE